MLSIFSYPSDHLYVFFEYLFRSSTYFSIELLLFFLYWAIWAVCISLFISSGMSDSLRPLTATHQASLSITNSQSLLKLMPVESVMPSNHLILCCPLLLLSSIFPSIRIFSNESALHIRWPKYWSLASSSVFPMNIQDWFPLEWTGWISLQSKGLSRVFSNTTVQKHQFFGAQLSLSSNSHIHTWLLERP